MKAKKIIQEAIDTVLTTENVVNWDNIIDGILGGKYTVEDWDTMGTNEVNLYCNHSDFPDGDNGLTITCDVTYDISNYDAGDDGNYWTPPSGPSYDTGNYDIESITISTEDSDEQTISPKDPHFSDLVSYLVEFIPDDAWNTMIESYMEDYEERMRDDYADWAYEASRDRDL